MNRSARALALCAVLALALTLPGRADAFRFAVYGDSRPNQPEMPSNLPVLESINQAVLKLSPKPDLVFFLGDLTDFHRTTDGRTALPLWDKTFAPFKQAGIRVLAAVGNHELFHQNVRNVLFRDAQEELGAHFLKTGLAEADGPKGLEGLAYTISPEGSDCFFAVLDTYPVPQDKESVPYTKQGWIGRTQLDWLKAKAEASPAAYKFLLAHNPPFYPLVEGQLFQGEDFQELWSILNTTGFTAYASGHVHAYARRVFGPRDLLGLKQDLLVAVAGLSGAPLDHRALENPPAAWNVKTMPHFLVFDVDKGGASMTMYGLKDGSFTPMDTWSGRRK